MICSDAFAPTLLIAAFAGAPRYGSTALLENTMFAVCANCCRLVGLMQPISSAICFDRPRTTEVEQPELVYADTETADVVVP